MKKGIIQFVLFALLGLGIGYLVFDVIASPENEQEIASADEKKEEQTNTETTENEGKEESEATAQGDSVFDSKGCLSCHAVKNLGLEGGTTGPDLSAAYTDVEGKHGKPIEEFLKAPTTAVMASVIEGAPLTDEEINQIVEELKKASEAN